MQTFSQLMTRRTLLMAGAFTVAAGSIVHSEASDTPTSLEQLLAQLRLALVVSPPKSAKQLGWLVGRWECRDRILRSPNRESPYAFLASMYIADDAIMPSRAFEGSDLKGGYTLVIRCSFIADQFGHVAKERSVNTEFHRKAFCFDMPYPDEFQLRRDPESPPAWIILEHLVAGDALFFRRRTPTDNRESQL
mgnify:CR=1 FL=1